MRDEAEASVSNNIPMTFQIYAGGELVKTETLSRDIIKIGKLPTSHLRIEDDKVSRMHAVIEVSGPDDIFIIDLGSASGTVVNGEKVNKSKLQSGDEVLLGDTKMVVEIGGAALGEEEPTMVAAPSEEVMAEAVPPAAAVPAAAAVAAPAPAAEVPNPFASNLPNPFAAPAAPAMHAGGHGDAEDSDNIQYGIVASGPPVSLDEVESGEQAVEVVVMWDRNVLHVSHLSPARSFYVGEAEGKGAQVDYLMGSEALGGTSRRPVCVEAGGGVAVVVPAGATAEVTINGATSAITDAQLQPCSEMGGAKQYPLPREATARVMHNGFTYMVKPVNAGKKIAAGINIEWTPWFYIGGSLFVFASLLIAFYFMPPSPASLSLDLLNTDSRLVKYLLEPPATEEEEEVEWLDDSKSQDTEGGKGKRHKDEEGQMGKKESKKTNNRYAIEGPKDNADPKMARENAKEQARNAGVLGTLKALTGSWNSPTSPYGADTALGNDPMSAMGALMGDQIGENFGFGGLGLRGTGRGGGGTGEGTIGLGNLGTIGHGGGGGNGNGYGRGAGGFRGRSARVPKIRSGAADVRGSLSKEVIRRVIRRHINEVRFCYEQELNQRPDLEGRVTVKFIISPTGSVQTSMVSNSTLKNGRVEKCVAGAVRRWTFPAPDGGGVVIVNYPFMLTNSG